MLEGVWERRGVGGGIGRGLLWGKHLLPLVVVLYVRCCSRGGVKEGRGGGDKVECYVEQSLSFLLPFSEVDVVFCHVYAVTLYSHHIPGAVCVLREEGDKKAMLRVRGIVVVSAACMHTGHGCTCWDHKCQFSFQGGVQ